MSCDRCDMRMIQAPSERPSPLTVKLEKQVGFDVVR
jgi:hypothetical protein